MSIALVHDYLTQRGGAERVVLSLLKAFPGAPLYTSLYTPDTTFSAFSGHNVQTAPLNAIPRLRHHHRLALPLLAPTFSRLHVDADVVLCSSSGWAHGVSTRGTKIVYCYSPARWLYQPSVYATGPVAKMALRLASARLVRWDRKAASTAARYLTSSRVVQARIRDVYGIDADVVPPPSTLGSSPMRPVPDVEPGFYLTVSRLLSYKNVGAVVDAFAGRSDRRLVIVGSGPERPSLRRRATANVHFHAEVDDAQLRWLYGNCVGVIAASYEDFGLTPLEAAALGRPSVVLRWGGFLDTVIEGTTGVFFDSPVAGAIAAALDECERIPWSATALQAHAASYDEEAFIASLRSVVADVVRSNAD